MAPGETSRPRTASNVAEYFGRLAGTYGDGAHYGNRRNAALAAIAPEIADAREVLDVGCGNGAYLTKFVEAAAVRTVTGVDLTFEMLLSARGRAGAKCRLIRADVARLPFKDAAFDFDFREPRAAVRRGCRGCRGGVRAMRPSGRRADRDRAA